MVFKLGLISFMNSINSPYRHCTNFAWTCEECEIGLLLGYSFHNCPRASIRCFQQCAARDSMLHSQHNLHTSFFFLIA